MKDKAEGILEIILALVVLFLSLWDLRVSIIIAVAALIVFGTIKLLQGKPVNQKVEDENKKINKV